jgi:hypothetical protein
MFLALYLLAGSMVLPLGDFSLINDLPDMYHSYSEVAAETPDAIDFIGDYILSGKDLFGHNKHDAPPKTNGSLQFQHQAISILYYNANSYDIENIALVFTMEPTIKESMFIIANYQNKSFRPPIV